MLYYTTIPMPDPGDIFIRYADNGEYERATVLSVLQRSKKDWQATLGCSRGWDFIEGTPERRAFQSWFPEGWIFDNVNQSFRPPNTQWDGKAMKFVAVDLGEAPVGRAAPGDPGGMQMIDRPVPGLDNVPDPRSGEHYMAWLARVKRGNTSANFESERTKAAIKAAWEDFKARQATTAAEANAAQQPSMR